MLEKNLAAKGQLQTGVGNSYNLLIQKPKTDQGWTLGKSPLELVRPTYKLAKSMTKTNSKLHELKTYNKAINNLIYGNR